MGKLTMFLTAADYHDLTSYDRNRMSGHSLDWSNQPVTFKTYHGLKHIELAGNERDSSSQNLDELLDTDTAWTPVSVNFDTLSRVLKLSHCLTRKEKIAGGYFYFRNVASAGALYPSEIYFLSSGTEGLEQGLYHHSPLTQSIVMLRNGNCLEALLNSINFQAHKSIRMVFLLTAIFFRSSWKYRDRAFRYHLLDTGHLIENLSLALKSEKLSFEISYDFDDARINELIGVDTNREACLAAVGILLEQDSTRIESGKDISPTIDLKSFSQCSSNEIRYPVINEIYSITSKTSKFYPTLSIENQVSLVDSVMGLVELPSVEKTPEAITFGEAFFQRRSRRNFVRKPVPAATFSWLMGLLNLGDSCGETAHWHGCVSVGVLIGAVETINPGFYLFQSCRHALSLIRPGLLTEEMAHICLDQEWLGRCSLHFVFLSNLEATENKWGSRGYRYAMLEAGRLGQRLYLAAESIKYGCCGIGAFYDKEAKSLLGLRSGSRMLYLVALGPLKKAFV